LRIVSYQNLSERLVICLYRQLHLELQTLELGLVATASQQALLGDFHVIGKIHQTYSPHPPSSSPLALLLSICNEKCKQNIKELKHGTTNQAMVMIWGSLAGYGQNSMADN